MAFTHGYFSVNEDLVSVWSNAVNDRFRDCCIFTGAKTVQPSFCFKLCTEDHGPFNAPGFDDLQQVMTLFAVQWRKQEFVCYDPRRRTDRFCPVQIILCIILHVFTMALWHMFRYVYRIRRINLAHMRRGLAGMTAVP